MKGNPKYKVGDKVSFKFDTDILQGEIYVVDKYGTFFDDSDVSYDIYVESKNCLYKHIKEPSIVE